MLRDLLLEVHLGDGAHHSVHERTILEKEDGRDGANPKPSRGPRVRVDVELPYDHALLSVLARKLLNDRTH
jgi:hypothetical protein